MMTRRDWWLGIAVLTAFLVFHAAVPRYAWHPADVTGLFIRVDRWTGTVSLGSLASGRWMPMGYADGKWTPFVE
jgi:hypothetical protein